MKTMFCKTESLKELMVRVKRFTEMEQMPGIQEYMTVLFAGSEHT